MCGVLLSTASLRLLLASLLRAGSEQRVKTGSALCVPNVDQLGTRCLLLLEAGLGDSPLTRMRQSPDFGTLSRLSSSSLSFRYLSSWDFLHSDSPSSRSEQRAVTRESGSWGRAQIAVTDRCPSFVVAAVVVARPAISTGLSLPPTSRHDTRSGRRQARETDALRATLSSRSCSLSRSLVSVTLSSRRHDGRSLADLHDRLIVPSSGLSLRRSTRRRGLDFRQTA